MNRVLAVENDPLTCQLLVLLLEEKRAELQWIREGEDILAAARQWPPDLLVLRARGRPCDGPELCRRIRADEVLTHVPVLVISAAHDPESRVEAFRAGADEFLCKPFDVEELDARLDTVFRLNRYRGLLSEQERFLRMAEASREGIVVTDHRGRLCFRNPAAADLLGLPEALEGNFHAYCLERFDCAPPELWQRLARNEPVEERRSLSLYPRAGTDGGGGSERVLHLERQPLGATAAGREYLLNIRDVTEEQANVGLLWSLRDAVSHKIRTPLNGVLANLSLLTDLREELSAEEYDEHMSLVVASARRLEETLVQSMTFFERGSICEDCRLSTDALPAMVASLAESLSLPTPSLTVAASGTMAVCEGFLEPVLRELFENASRFHPSGSPAIEVTLSPDASAGMWTLRITDDGIWLPEDKLERLGTPFYQVEEGFTGEMTGSGLGLAGLVHGVRRIGGEVSFANRPDRPGFQVALRFRVAEAGDEPASEPATDAVDGTDEASARRAGPP